MLFICSSDCSNSLTGGVEADTGDCDMACSGDSNEICGAGNRLSVYYHRQEAPTGPAPVGDHDGWTARGCYNDSVTARVLSYQVTYPAGTRNTISHCIAACDAAGFAYAGAEYGAECCGYCSFVNIPDITKIICLVCGNEFKNDGAPVVNPSECNMPCDGDSTEVCGAGNRLSVYYNGNITPSGPSALAAYKDWTSQGCYT
jgi:hypothetical protein